MQKTTKVFSRTLFSEGPVTVSLVYDTRRLKESGLYPVKFRVTFLRRQVYIKANIDLTRKQWESMPDARSQNLKEYRGTLEKAEERLRGHIKEMNDNEGFSFEGLFTRLSMGTKNSIIAAFLNKEEALRKEGRIGSADWYLYSMKAIKRFLLNPDHDEPKKEIKEPTKDLKFHDVTPAWLNKFETFLLKESKSYTSISMYMRALQAIMNNGIEEKIITNAQYPFGQKKYEVPIGEGRKLALTLPQIRDILQYPLLTDTEKRCRDLWFFSYLCNGINMNDLLRLKYKNIEAGEIYYLRRKTFKNTKRKTEIRAIVLPEMQHIIDKWGNKNRRPDNYIFPFLTDGITATDEQRIIKNVTRLINKKMKDIGEALQMGNISTYTARHSFATVLKRSGANIAYISEALGHSDIRTTENYLSSFEREEREKNAAILTKFD